VFAASVVANTSYDDLQGSITTKAGATFIPFPVNFGTRMDIELNKNSILLIGRETWEKGNEIVFRVSADENMALSVGILPAENMDSGFEYNDYGQFIHKRLDDVNPEEQDISFVVPETGEYGIGVQHINYEVNLAASEFFMPENKEQPSDANIIAASAPQSVDSDTVSIELKINKVFKNPLIK
jgi:hypothetical protein